MRWVSGFLAATVLTATAVAQPPPDPLEACAQQADPAARLACFDREMQRRHAARSAGAGHTPGVPSASSPSAVSRPPGVSHVEPPAHESHAAAARLPPSPLADRGLAASSGADDTVGLQGDALRKRLRAEGRERRSPQPIAAEVARYRYGPDHRYIFFLDNGQVWQQADSQPGLFVRAHESITITPGALGSFFLENSSHQFVRVRRLD